MSETETVAMNKCLKCGHMRKQHSQSMTTNNYCQVPACRCLYFEGYTTEDYVEDLEKEIKALKESVTQLEDRLREAFQVIRQARNIMHKALGLAPVEEDE